MTTPTIRTARSADADDIKRVAVDAQLFSADEVDVFDEMLAGFFDGSLVGHMWLVAEVDDRVVGGAYVGPESFGDRIWNLYFLAVDPSIRRRTVAAPGVHCWRTSSSDSGR